MIEVLVGTSILAIALLGHTAASWSASRLATFERSRSEGMRFSQQFIERLRAEDDWNNLYARLKLLEDAGGANLVELNSGLRARPVTDYFADFTDPPPAGDVAVRVDVPGTWSGTSLPVLREDAVAPEFGLPSDLDGDGAIDNRNHALDYVALPLVVTIRYRLEGDQPYELRIATWLRGNR